MVAQRVFGLALGYEDLNDHDDLRHDPLLATVVGKVDARRKDCAPLAGKSTLNRLEHAPAGADRATRRSPDARAIERLFVDLFLQAHGRRRQRIVLDLDATDDPIHGHQLGRFFHGYYKGYCYLPLYIFCGEHLLCARLRPSDIDASAGAVEEIERIVAQIREAGPGQDRDPRRQRLLPRGAHPWCEDNGVDYVIGLARNERLVGGDRRELAGPRLRELAQGGPARRFADFAGARSTAGAASAGGGQGRAPGQGRQPALRGHVAVGRGRDARSLYEEDYCGRGEMENRIKEQQLHLFADRTSATMRANQIRLWFASIAYVLLEALRRIGLSHTQFATATCGTIRLKLLKIGALVRISCAGSRSRWPRPSPGRTSTRWSISGSPRRLLNAPGIPPRPHRGPPPHVQNPLLTRTPGSQHPQDRHRLRTHYHTGAAPTGCEKSGLAARLMPAE